MTDDRTAAHFDVERQAPRPDKNERVDFDSTQPYDACSWFLICVSYFLCVLTFPFTFFLYFKIVQQYERAVIFRLGRLKKGGAVGPGLFFVLPCIDEYRKVDLRVVSFAVPPQEVLSKDSVTVEVDAVVYFRIFDATISIVNIENAISSTKLLAQTTLRTTLGTKTLSELLAHREELSAEMQTILDAATEAWGVKVQRVEMKDLRLPPQMRRIMAAEAEAGREAKAKVISAQGERDASSNLRDAAEILGTHPAALQLRYLQTLNQISAEHNSTIIFPLPMDVMSAFMPQLQSKMASSGYPIASMTTPAFIPHASTSSGGGGGDAHNTQMRMSSAAPSHSRA